MFKPLIQLYLQIMILRKGPQDLPYSRALLALLSVLAFCLGLFIMLLPDSKGQTHPLEQTVLFVLVQYAALMGSVFLLLRILKYSARVLQTLCALLGVDILFNLLQLGLYLLSLLMGADNAAIVIFNYVLMIWVLVVNATILRHALAISILAAGVLAYTLFLLSLYIYYQFGLLGG